VLKYLNVWHFALVTSALDGYGDEHYVPVTLLRGRVRGTHLKGCWVSPRLGLDVLTKMRVPEPARNRTRIVPPLATHFTDSWP
jgi:hypothetical protein